MGKTGNPASYKVAWDHLLLDRPFHLLDRSHHDLLDRGAGRHWRTSRHRRTSRGGVNHHTPYTMPWSTGGHRSAGR
jgi:hypothetical protein